MATRVLISVDTELRHGPFVAGASWQENLGLSFEPAGVGVSYQLEMLRRHGLKASFFVDPMPALLYGLEPVRTMVETILEGGQEVQLHLHPSWADAARGRALRFAMSDFGEDEQFDLLSQAIELLVAAGAPRPIGFRAGSYAANADTLHALRRLGLRYDTSHNGAAHPSPSALPLGPDMIDPAECCGVTELPITQISSGEGVLRPLQICAVSSAEMHGALRHAAGQDQPLVTIVSHSFELATRDGRSVNHLVKSRFDRLCGFLADHRETMPTTHLTELGEVASAARSAPMPPRWPRTAARMAEQAWGTMVYERRLAAIAAAAPLGILAYAACAEL